MSGEQTCIAIIQRPDGTVVESASFIAPSSALHGYEITLKLDSALNCHIEWQSDVHGPIKGPLRLIIDFPGAE
jgi:hypothetical protein